MSIGQRNGLHEVNSLGIDLDEGDDVPGFHGVTQRVKLRCRLWTLLPSETFLRVLGGDEVFPCLPGGRWKEEAAQFLLRRSRS